MDDREIVAAIRARLADRVGQERYDVWFGPGTQMVLRGDTLEISVRDQFFQDWLRSHFRKDLETASQEVCSRPLALEFRIAPVAALPRPVTGPAAGSAPPVCAANSLQGNGARPAGGAADSNNHLSAALAPPRRQLASLIVRGGQLELRGTQNGAGCGRAARHVLAAIDSRPHRHRQDASARRHLCGASPSATGASTVYLSAEQFTSGFLEALHGSGLPSFRRKYRHVELLVIDDVQFFANKRATLVEVLHTVETLLRGGRQLVFAADRPPAALKMLGPELMARLSGGMVCRLEPPEYATRLGIVRQAATRAGLAVPGDVEAYIASNFTTQSRESGGALKRLQATSHAHERPITLALAEEALAELIDHQGRVVKLADIERAVCDVLGLDPASLQSGAKAKSVSHPRMLAMFLAREHTRAALAEMGAYFGRRSHSTVISAQKKVESWMADGTAVHLDNRSTSLEETIRRVEERLRAG